MDVYRNDIVYGVPQLMHLANGNIEYSYLTLFPRLVLI